MQVVHSPPRYFPAISGAEFYFQRLSEILRRKHDITVHCTNALDFQAFFDQGGKVVKPKPSPEVIRNVRVFRHPVDHDPSVVGEERSAIRGSLTGAPAHVISAALEEGPASRSLRKALESSDAQLFHTTCFPYQNILVSLHAARRKKIPCLVTPFVHFENQRYRRESIGILDLFDRILACSRAERDFLVSNGIRGGKIDVVTMGVDAGLLERAPAEPFVRRTGVDPTRNQIVLFSGYKNHEKGAITMLEALPRVAAKFDKVRFVMIGPPTKQYHMEMSKLGALKKHVVNINPASLTGYFDKVKLGAFKACHVYAMPSRSDAYGIAYLEAFACKKPVIAAAIPAMMELFPEGKECLHVPFGNHEELAERIIFLLEHDRDREELGLNGFEKIEREGLTWRDVAGRLDGIYSAAQGGDHW
ncbi:MAG: glycosyltransferase family 4 protein [Candidatus Lokiarchaeota archaeon]|nr:glycosyltransferase family 4 protein [Candidatus Lokiarchaeota archaeon]